jgi:hypothetical protein
MGMPVRQCGHQLESIITFRVHSDIRTHLFLTPDVHSGSGMISILPFSCFKQRIAYKDHNHFLADMAFKSPTIL